MDGALSNPLIAAFVGLALIAGWLVATLVVVRRRAVEELGGERAWDALVDFAERSLELESPRAVFAFTGEAAQQIFGSRLAVAFEPGAEPGEWESSGAGGEPLPPVPAHLRGVFGWFRHNSVVAAEGDLGHPRFGAMRAPLQQVMDRYGVDVLVPFVRDERVYAVLGLLLQRQLSARDRELMHLLRMQATAAYANVRLHREAAHLVSLAHELDLAKSVELALVPASAEGRSGRVSWAGHFEAAGEAASDYWGAYELDDGRVALIVGDAIGDGLAGSMISAAAKGCADVIFEKPPAGLGPGTLLGMLSRALAQGSGGSAKTSCFAAFFDPQAAEVAYSNAAHPAPYVVEANEGGVALGSLSRPGPLLGDGEPRDYPVRTRKLAPGAAVVLHTNGLVKTDGDTRKAERRLQRLLREQGRATAEELRDAVVGDMRQHRVGAAPADDVVLVAVRVDL